MPFLPKGATVEERLVSRRGITYQCTFVHCVASDRLTQTRLRERSMNENEVSDGRWEIYLEQKARAEALDEFSGEVCLDLSTDTPIEDLRRASEQLLRANCRVLSRGPADPHFSALVVTDRTGNALAQAKALAVPFRWAYGKQRKGHSDGP